MALRLPLRPSPQSTWAVTHERLTLGTREPQLGTWQRLFLVELDGPRSREIVVTTAGLPGSRPRERSALRSLPPELVEEPV